jgi:hypothetical protein
VIADSATLRERLIGALTADLGDSYDCIRVWSAWGVGTMTEDDFAPVTNRVDDIVDSLLRVITAEPAADTINGQPFHHELSPSAAAAFKTWMADELGRRDDHG